jgi:hypothetical protein
MAKQTFTTGQVLTAAQMTSLQQTAMSGGAASAKVASYVLVAADGGTAISMTNAGATTITVNTGLFAAGDTVTIVNLGAGVCTVTAGTATVSTSGSLVLAQNQGGILYFTSASAALFLQFATPASGDIEGVTAGTGLTGGGTSGTVTVSLSTPVAVANGGTGISSFGTGVATFLGTPSSANLAAALTDETGTGAAVFGTSPTIATPVISSPKISSTYSAKTAAYTFVSGDEGNIFSMNNAATQQFNIPTDATFNFAVGTEINVFWITGAGQPTIGAVTPGTTTVISTGATSATPKLRVANSGATCKKLAANSWIVFGDIA